jgi:hypothetical protein
MAGRMLHPSTSAQYGTITAKKYLENSLSRE